jgi:glucose/arabinose dehydrogenase
VKRSAVTLALLAVLVVLAACGSDEGNAESSPATTGSSAETPPTAVKASAADGVKLVDVGSFDMALHVAAPPGDKRRVFVVEQGGTVRVVRSGRRLSRPFLDVRGKIIAGGEQGLLSIAFAPDYAKTRRFYVNYTDKSGTQSVVEYRRSKSSSDRADAGSARLVLRYDGVEANHNGGLLAFGPDKLMYIGTGDGGGGDDQHGTRGNAQDLGSLLGKLLRIDPRKSGSKRYRIPPSNPFVGKAGARGEIYSYGLRNPWRFAFDRKTGDLAIADVGQDEVEEIDFAKKGGASGVNYGWRPLEGTRRNFDEPAPGAVAPVLEPTHADGNCSITGGYVVRDAGVPALLGRYVYGDLCKGQLRSVKLSPGQADGDAAIPGLKKIDQLASFGEDGAGRVYVVSLSGPVYRLAAG